MSKTVVRKNESLDDALRRFKRAVTKAGTLQETRKMNKCQGKTAINLYYLQFLFQKRQRIKMDIIIAKKKFILPLFRNNFYFFIIYNNGL